MAMAALLGRAHAGRTCATNFGGGFAGNGTWDSHRGGSVGGGEAEAAREGCEREAERRAVAMLYLYVVVLCALSCVFRICALSIWLGLCSVLACGAATGCAALLAARGTSSGSLPHRTRA